MAALGDLRKEMMDMIANLEQRVTTCEETDEKQNTDIDELKNL